MKPRKARERDAQRTWMDPSLIQALAYYAIQVDSNPFGSKPIIEAKSDVELDDYNRTMLGCY